MVTTEEIKNVLEADGINYSDEQLKALESLVNSPPPPEGMPLNEAQLELISGGGFWRKARNTLIGAGLLTATAAAAYIADDKLNDGKGFEAVKGYAGTVYDGGKSLFNKKPSVETSSTSSSTPSDTTTSV